MTRPTVLEAAGRLRAVMLWELDPDGGVPFLAYGRAGRAIALSSLATSLCIAAAALRLGIRSGTVSGHHTGSAVLVSGSIPWSVVALPIGLFVGAGVALFVARRRMRARDARVALVWSTAGAILAPLAGVVLWVCWRPTFVAILVALQVLGPLGGVHLSTVWALGAALLGCTVAAEAIVLAALIAYDAGRVGGEMLKFVRVQHRYLRANESRQLGQR
jgi:hypothetical protein